MNSTALSTPGTEERTCSLRIQCSCSPKGNDDPSSRHTSHSNDGSGQALPPGIGHKNEWLRSLYGYKLATSLQTQLGSVAEPLDAPHCHTAPSLHTVAETFLLAA